MTEQHGDYGYDAPYALVAFAALSTAGSVAAVVSWWGGNGRLAAKFGAYAAFFLAHAFSFLYTTRRGKFQVWNEVLDELHLRGDERVPARKRLPKPGGCSSPGDVWPLPTFA